MNKLYILKAMGFKISWKLITIGLFGDGEIPPSITHFDVVEYLDSLLTEINEQTDDIITLFCEKDNVIEFNCILKKFASEDITDVAVQKRKWRACLLKVLIEKTSKDCLQGMLDLMEFWISMGKPNDCPQVFPCTENKKSVQDCFSQASYEFNLNNNQKWLNEEIRSIIRLEA